MIGIYIGFGLMTFAAVLGYYENRRLLKDLKRAEMDNRDFRNLLIAQKIDYQYAVGSPAKVEEVINSIVPYFRVYRKGREDKHTVQYYKYDPNDPDDREYKRIHAEEVAEMLNEEP